MNVDSVRKRGWVKNGTIVFLIILVGLLFLSNTIMNHGLPEVAAQYTSSGTITARVRGSGTITPIESYEVITSQTRTVSEVRVRLGDEVETGDVLITLTGSASEELESLQTALRDLEISLERLLINTSLDGDYARENRAIQNLRSNLTDAQNALAAVPGQGTLNAAQAAVNAALAVVGERQADVDFAQAVVVAALEVLDSLNETDFGYPEAVAELERALEALSIAQTALGNAEVARNEAISYRDSVAIAIDGRPMLEQNVRSAERAVADALFDLAQQQRADQISASNTDIDIRELNRQIDEKQEEIQRLEGEGNVSELTSPVSGVVTAVSISPGSQTQVDVPLMVIEVVDRGYILSIPVTAEQSTRVSVGDNAEVDRGWWSWGEEITARLTSIRNDPHNPATGRLLDFLVHGDVEGGTQLNVTLNQRSENFQIIVPNSAIRTDTNGNFVLVVASRSGPLGNRFIATRADINILASDDTHSAVSGGLTGWDFVITHSNRPVEPGMQVQLTDSP